MGGGTHACMKVPGVFGKRAKFGGGMDGYRRAASLAYFLLFIDVYYDERGRWYIVQYGIV
jgi:hypothetical protein